MYDRKLVFFWYKLRVMGSATCGTMAATAHDNERNLVSWGCSERRGFGSPYTQFLLEAGIDAGFEGEAFLPLRTGQEFLREVVADLLETCDTSLWPLLVAEAERSLAELRRDLAKTQLYNRAFVPVGEKDRYEFDNYLSWAEGIVDLLKEVVSRIMAAA